MSVSEPDFPASEGNILFSERGFPISAPSDGALEGNFLFPEGNVALSEDNVTLSEGNVALSEQVVALSEQVVALSEDVVALSEDVVGLSEGNFVRTLPSGKPFESIILMSVWDRNGAQAASLPRRLQSGVKDFGYRQV